MVRPWIGLLMVLGLSVSAFAQGEKPIDVKFRDASPDAFLQYISKMTGYVFVHDKGLKLSGTVTCYSETPIPREKILDTVNTALRPLNATTELLDNKVVRVVSIDVKMRSNLNVQLGNDPDKLENSDTVITQIIPLKNMQVAEFDKNLNKLYPKSVDVARDPMNNLFVMSGPSSEIKRFLTVLKKLDISSYETLKIEIVSLKNATAMDTTKVLNDIFKKETGGQNNAMGGGWWQFFGGGGGGGRGDRGGGGEQARGGPTSMADFIRIIPDTRTNSIIIAATEEKVTLIKELVLQLEERNVGVSQLRLFRLKNASAKEVADAVTALFKSPENMADQMRRSQARQIMWWQAQSGMDPAPTDTVRAIPDMRTNSIIVAATEGQLKTIEMIVEELDREYSELIKVKMIQLKNAEATSMAQTLNDLFKKETTPAATGGRGGGNAWMQMFRGGGGSTSSPTTPASDVIKIVPDVRTNSIMLAATEDNLKMIEKVVADLDNDTMATLKFVTYPLKYADSREVASVITSLFTESASTGPTARGMSPQQRSQFQQLARQSQGDNSAPIAVKTISDMRTNTVYAVGTEAQIKVINQLVSELDREVTDFTKVRIYTLKNADATQMSTVVKGIFATTSTTAARSGGALTRAVDIQTDTRTNSLIVKASDENLAIIDDVIKILDTKPTESETTFIFQPKNANAVNLMQTIQGLLKGGVAPNQNQGQNRTGQPGSAQNRQGQGQNRGGQGQTGDFQMQGPQVPGRSNRLGPDGQDEPQDEEPPMPQAPRAQEGQGVTGRVDIQADQESNKIIVRTSPRNMDAIRQILEELDRFRPQVLVRVLITEVTLDKNTEYGVEWRYNQANRTVKNDKLVQTLATNFTMGTGGFSYLLQADQYEANLRLFARDGRLKVLATPRILVLDNQEASITVGKLVPFIQSSRQTPEGNIINTIQYEDIGILLRVTPHINPDGLVTMLIHPEVSEVASAAESVQISDGVLAPTFNKNAADTSVAVRHGQTIVLGGLIREFDDHAVEKIPVLGDIPVLGGLFSSTTQRKVRRELMIFITPHVVYNQSELEELTELEKAKLKLIDPRDIEVKGREWRALLKD